jgi:hypothetical protein
MPGRAAVRVAVPNKKLELPETTCGIEIFEPLREPLNRKPALPEIIPALVAVVKFVALQLLPVTTDGELSVTEVNAGVMLVNNASTV